MNKIKEEVEPLSKNFSLKKKTSEKKEKLGVNLVEWIFIIIALILLIIFVVVVLRC